MSVFFNPRIWHHLHFQVEQSFLSRAQALTGSIKAARQARYNQPFIQGTRILQPSVQNKHKNVHFQLNVLFFPSKLALQRMKGSENRRKA